MTVNCGLDLHRQQITFDWVDNETGEFAGGRIAPANRDSFREWLGRFEGRRVELVVEGCTGWRFVAEECRRAGVGVHVADPGEATTIGRSHKKRAKTDRVDARHLRELLEDGKVPESWLPPPQALEARALVRLYRDLVQERSRWQQSRSASTGSGAFTPSSSGPSSATRPASPPPTMRCATPAWTSRCTPPTANAPAGGSPAKAPRCCAGRCTRLPATPRAPAPRTTTTTCGRPHGSVGERATLSVARKLTRRCHHRLRALGHQAFAEVPDIQAA